MLTRTGPVGTGVLARIRAVGSGVPARTSAIGTGVPARFGSAGLRAWTGSAGPRTWGGLTGAGLAARARTRELTGLGAGLALIGHPARCPVRWSSMVAATRIAVGCVVWHWLADQPIIHAMLALASIELNAGCSAGTAAGSNVPRHASQRQM